jgi:diguanylate cyclase (GGDEF)-like protein
MLVNDAALGRRNDAIARLGVLERAGDPALTGLTRLACFVTGAQAAAVHIIDAEHQNRVAATNAPLVAESRENSMCRLVVDSEQRIVCEDASTDPRFGYSSYVQGPDPVRFYASVPLTTADGTTVGTLCAFDTVPREITEEQTALLQDLADQVTSQIELTRLAVELGDVASHDPLTGAVNRLVLGDRLAQAFRRRQRSQGETFLALLDIDDFKTINDVYGHDAGDEVLVEVAHRLRQRMRAEDTVARLGGDEFVVLAELVPTMNGDVAAEMTQRIEAALAPPILFGGEPRPVGVSVGCVLAEPGQGIRELLARADEAMYERKAQKRALSRR